MIKLLSETNKIFECSKEKLIKYTKFFQKYYKLKEEEPNKIKDESEFKFDVSDETLSTFCHFLEKDCRVKRIKVTEELITFADYINCDNLKYEIYCEENIYPIIPIFMENLKDNSREMIKELDEIYGDDKHYFAYIGFDETLINNENKVYKLWKYSKYTTLSREDKFDKFINTAYCLVFYIKKWELLCKDYPYLERFWNKVDGTSTKNCDLYLKYISKYLVNEINGDKLYDIVKKEKIIKLNYIN